MLTDLPVEAVRYAALLNTAMRRNGAGRMVNWNHHGTGLYEQMGFDYLPWLQQWPHEKALQGLPDADARFAELRRQDYRSDFGSADNVAQVLDRYPDLVSSDKQYLLTHQTLTRQDSPGWRWHKNGPYIGTRNQQCEHLGDEPEIDQIITWEIWQLLPGVPDLAGHWRDELSEWLVARMAGRVLPPLVLDL